MSGKFGWRSGRVNARNLESGKFNISGTIGETVDTAVVFKRRFTAIPDIQLTQVLDTIGSSTYNVNIANSDSNISGSSISISGATTSGFTAHTIFGQSFSEAAGDASGARFSYFAHDFVEK